MSSSASSRPLPRQPWMVLSMLWLVWHVGYSSSVCGQGMPPSITSKPASRTNASGTVATFSVEATGTAPLHYQWYRNQLNPIPDATNSVLVLANVQLSDSGAYHVAVTNEAGSTNSAEATLLVRIPPA